MKTYNWEGVNPDGYFLDKLEPIPSGLTPSQLYVFMRSEERFSRNAETDLVCRLLLEKKKNKQISLTSSYVIFFFNDTATTEIYTLSLHDALPIFQKGNKNEP